MEERKNVGINADKNTDINAKDLLAGYEQALGQDARSRATMEKYLRDVRKFLDFLEQSGFQKVEREQVEAYREHLNKEYKIRSVNSMLAAVNSFFEYAGWEECKVRQFQVKETVFDQRESDMTEVEFKRLLEVAEKKEDARLKLLIQTICSTGIRISELKDITVEACREGAAKSIRNGKLRYVLLPAPLVQELNDYCSASGIESGSIFVTKNQLVMDRSNINKKLKELGKEAGIPEGKVFPHNLRHLSARIFYVQEKDRKRLMDLHGYAKTRTMRVYTPSVNEKTGRELAGMKLGVKG